MLIISKVTNRPGIRCDRCGDPLTIEDAIALRWKQWEGVSLVSLECAEQIKKYNPDITVEPAVDFFRGLFARKRELLFPSRPLV